MLERDTYEFTHPYDDDRQSRAIVETDCRGAGYLSDGGIFVGRDDALEYALKECGLKIIDRISFEAVARRDFVEWFYSGAWEKVGDFMEEKQ